MTAKTRTRKQLPAKLELQKAQTTCVCHARSLFGQVVHHSFMFTDERAKMLQAPKADIIHAWTGLMRPGSVHPTTEILHTP